MDNGNTDMNAIRNAIEEAKSVTDKPSFIKVPSLHAKLLFLNLEQEYDGGTLHSLLSLYAVFWLVRLCIFSVSTQLCGCDSEHLQPCL